VGELSQVIASSDGVVNQVSVLVSVADAHAINPLLHTQLGLEARVGIEHQLLSTSNRHNSQQHKPLRSFPMKSTISQGFPDFKNYLGQGRNYFQSTPQLLRHYYFTGAFTGGDGAIIRKLILEENGNRTRLLRFELLR
jgi:hypothetical protein